MIGYFLRNEPAWAFVDNLVIADEVLRDPEVTACKTGLIVFLKQRYKTIRALSDAWQHSFRSFEELLEPVNGASAYSPQARADLREYSASMWRSPPAAAGPPIRTI